MKCLIGPAGWPAGWLSSPSTGAGGARRTVWRAVQLRRVRLGDPLVDPLLAGLHDEYRTRYGANDEMSHTEEHQFDPPTGLFLVLVAEGPHGEDMAVAGGGFRWHAPGICEVKRMWTHPGHRRRGLAAEILDGLEREATAAGYHQLVLETGPRQPEAEALYARRGYTRVPAYGPYEQARAFAVELTGRA